MINAIGDDIDLTDECIEKISEVREAYEALSREEKRYVKNYNVLTAAEQRLQIEKPHRK